MSYLALACPKGEVVANVIINRQNLINREQSFTSSVEIAKVSVGLMSK